MRQTNKILEIKLEYHLEDGEQFWECYDIMTDCVEKRKDIPIDIAVKFLSIISKPRKAESILERERISKIYFKALSGIEEQNIKLNGYVVREYIAPFSERVKQREEYNLEDLVSYVLMNHARSDSREDIRVKICYFVLRYLDNFNVNTKKLSEYKRAFISCKIIEALGSIVLDNKVENRTVAKYYNSIQYHYKKAKDRLNK